MQRKLIKLSRKSLVVTMPYEWVERNKLKKGDSIEAIDKGHELLIVPSGDTPSRTCRLDMMKANDRLVRRMLAAAYKSGFEVILVNCTSSQRDYVESLVDNFFGLIVTSKIKGLLTIKNTTHFNAEEYEQVLKKAALIVSDIAEGILKAMEAKKIHTLHYLLKRKEQLVRQTNLALAILNTAGHRTIREANTHFYIISLIDSIGDLYFHIATSYANGDRYQDDVDFFKKVTTFYRQTRLALFDNQSIEQLYAIRETLYHPSKKGESGTLILLKVIGKLTIELVECKIMLALLENDSC
jgi:phosphate uptake regulator